ncbi:hypothetical protein CJ030_MR3G018955 [Morella rubra]|uniref:Fiber protein Fb34 n=1 Tax=Morella rubra TaxID=262757 RepID=A0A6A1WDY7_9ROSI|nr:hypothetical protein CJ030_MR3G018955 [Morella rubra]
MGEGRGSTLVHLLVVVLSLVAFGFAIAAERRRSTGHLAEDPRRNETYCVYNSDVATGYGVGSFLFLLSSESLLMGVTKCMCFGRPLAPGGNRAWSIIYFVSSCLAMCMHKIFSVWQYWDSCDDLFTLVADGHLAEDPRRNETYCVYNSDVATGYGVGSFLFLLSSESLLMGVTKCMCFGRPLAPGGNRAWSIIYFVSSWVTFLVAEACLLAGATKNAYHTKYRSMVYAQNFSCETLRKGVFIAGAVFVVATMILNVYFYMYFTKATATPAAHKSSRTGPTVGMTGYA